MAPKVAQTTVRNGRPTDRQADLLAKRACEVLGKDLDNDSCQLAPAKRYQKRRMTPSWCY
jgi:hypothetical protein